MLNSVYFFAGKVIPNDRVHPRLWKGSNRKFRFIPRKKNEIKKQNKVSAIVSGQFRKKNSSSCNKSNNRPFAAWLT